MNARIEKVYENGGIAIIMDRARRDDGCNTIALLLDRRYLTPRKRNNIINRLNCYTVYFGEIYKMIFKVDTAKLSNRYFMQMNKMNPVNPKVYISGTADVLLASIRESINDLFTVSDSLLLDSTAGFNWILNKFFKDGATDMNEDEQEAIQPLNDLEIIHFANMRGRDDFKRLFDEGDFSACKSGTEDGAGLALTNRIAAFCEGRPDAADTIKRIFKNSLIYSNNPTYWDKGNHLDHTIQNSLGNYNRARTEYK